MTSCMYSTYNFLKLIEGIEKSFPLSPLRALKGENYCYPNFREIDRERKKRNIVETYINQEGQKLSIRT